ncbi:MAG TPA: LysM domain-containing protein [Gaiellaceae bacterium]|nr:LysM domain-containing protein [Gaiellaceae bacterium]
MVGTFAARGWRPYAGPIAFLLVATIAIWLLRGHLGAHGTSPPAPAKAAVHAKLAHRPGRTLYVVRAGDTIAAIASRIGTTTARILRLNPSVSPTALFIGEKIRLR